ncbi:MAG: 3-isopropylmalate dehydratase [Candidatus Eisenbacteria bacterium]|nr:3-isopropylmalate dehydratase [Candidatus Eisenbacteria bacterium]
MKGRVWVLGDNVDTDVIYPGKYLPIIVPEEMALHALEGVDPQFASKLKPGDIIVAGSNFGCGSSREQAATCLKAAGVAAVVAGSYSRIFFRNALNQGLPLVESRECSKRVKEGDVVTIDFGRGKILLPGGEMSFEPLPSFLTEILEDGGLIEHTKKKIAKEQ